MQLRFIGLLLAVALTGCAGRGPVPGPFPGQAVESAAYLSQVPFYAQDEYQCGPASLAMMLNSQGLKSTPAALRKQVYIPGREGSLAVEMVAAARAHGLVAYPLEKDLTAVIIEVAAGNPVLVMQNLRFDWWPQWHFAVVVGYDLAEQELILRSGLEAEKRTGFRTFDMTWARSDRWARVMLPPETLPATAEPLSYMRAAYDLEQTGRQSAAAEAYRSATKAWPDSVVARFAAANLALTSGRVDEARSQFTKLLEQHPNYPPAWHNLALSLDPKECPKSVHKAQACAQLLAPDDPRFADRHERGESGEQSTTGTDYSPAQCEIPSCPL